MEDDEYQKIRVKPNNTGLQILSFYCPSDRPLSLDTIDVPSSSFLAISDFNSHRAGDTNYLDRQGEEVEDWQDEHHLILNNSCKTLQPTPNVGAELPPQIWLLLLRTFTEISSQRWETIW